MNRGTVDCIEDRERASALLQPAAITISTAEGTAESSWEVQHAELAPAVPVRQEEYIKEEQRSLKRELLRAQEEVKRIQSVPLVIGQFLEMVDGASGIVGSTTGSNYYVRILSTLNRRARACSCPTAQACPAGRHFRAARAAAQISRMCMPCGHTRLVLRSRARSAAL
jgi:hypothetical protein